MPPSAAQIPSTPVTPAKPDDADVEPDEEWKNRLRKEIEENLASMVKEAKDSRDNQLREAPVSAEDRERLTTEYKTAMNNIRQLAAEQFQIELDRERQERRWASGIPMNPQWTEALKQEQQTIMDRIKQGGTGSTQPGSGRIAESPVEELPRPRPPGARTMSNHDPPPSLPQPPAQHQEKAAKAERDRERVARPVVPVPPQPLAVRRGSDAHSASSHDREEHLHSFRKVASRGALHERPSLPDTWVTPEVTEEPEDLFKRPRRPTLEKPVDKWDPSLPLSATKTPDRERSQRSVSERHTAHSPPNSIPAIWKPSISPEEDAAASKPYNLGRRGSTASMRSIGSATGIRPLATEPIPERSDDDAIHEGGNDKEKGPMKESDKPWISPLERKESGLHRSDSRSYPAPSERDDRAGLATRRTSPIPYPAPSSTARPIVSKASFNEEHRYDRPKAQYLADRDQPSPLSAGPRSATYDRDLPHPSAGARPIAQIFPRAGDDRDYSPSPPYRDYIPHRHRSSPDSAGTGERGIAPKHSFSNDDYQDARRDRERERQYSSLSSSRPSYPTPPSSATRARSREYLHNDSFDDRERSDRHWTPDESDHRPIRARQGSYSSRPPWDETERDRRYDDYSTRTHHGGPSTTKPITVPRHHVPPPLGDEVSSWKDWVGIPEGRRGYDPNFRPPQLPPIPGPVIAPHSADPLPRRRDSYRSAPHSARYHDEPASYSHRHRPYDDDELEEDYEDEPGPPKDNFVSHAPMRAPSVSRRKDRKTQEEEEEEVLRRLEAEKQRVLEERERRKLLELEAGKPKRETADEEDETDETDDDEEEGKRLEEEETRKRAEEQKRVEEEKQRLEEERKRVEEEKRKVEEEKKKMEDEKKKAEQEEAKRVKEKRKEERKQTEEKRKAEAALKQLEVENRKRQEEAELLEEKIRDKMAEAERLEKEALEKEATAKRLQEEAQAKAAKINQMNTLAKKREAEMRQRELALRQREDELARREEEYSRREEEARAQEERENEEKERIRLENEEKERVRLENEEKERVQAEEAAKAREAERKERQRQLDEEREAKFQREQQAHAKLEDARRREAQRREEANRIARERQAEEDRVRNEQQEEFRRREEEIKRRSEERKRQDSTGAEGIWPGPSPSAPTSRSPPQRNGSVHTPAGDRTSNGSSSAWSTSSNWSSSTKATTASNTSASSNAVPNRATPVPHNKPRAGSVGSGGTFPFGTPPHPTPTPMSEADWQRRQAEQARKQQEQFRKEQERLEAERQAKAGGRQLTRDELIWLFENHEKLWANLPSSDAGWNDFPWPMIKKPSEPEEITLPAVRAYIESPHYPEKDKSKAIKDRVKDHIKRWHPDRFNTKLLTKVREEDKEKVKEGAGTVVRCLNELLAKTNGPLFD